MSQYSYVRTAEYCCKFWEATRTWYEYKVLVLIVSLAMFFASGMFSYESFIFHIMNGMRSKFHLRSQI